MKITSEIEFNPDLKLQEQSLEFQLWLSDSCLSKINDRYVADALDAYDRPILYRFAADGFNVELTPVYIANERSNWAISGYDIIINTIE